MTYTITKDYIRHGNSRSGIKNDGIKFIVSHDTGNPNSTAYGNRNWFNRAQPVASAHTFIDDKYILEMLPLDEKAWHVQYQKPTDNELYGDDANDCAIGVELCYGSNIDFTEAYNRYVWYHAYLCEKYSLDPNKHIVSHATLDPQRKTDPHNALNQYGITWKQFIKDVDDMLIDGKCNIEFNGEQIEGIIIDGVSYAPVRKVSEMNGLTVGWNGETNTVKLED